MKHNILQILLYKVKKKKKKKKKKISNHVKYFKLYGVIFPDK